MTDGQDHVLSQADALTKNTVLIPIPQGRGDKNLVSVLGLVGG